ncbi:serum paraoxonase/arylesterase 1-like [Ptychodera flava]|uniref:serum paraoxonase/arylesterase 1-like n=1 Tax=Ptychodera flava TaxID=63121 RepID=UPI00396A9ED6
MLLRLAVWLILALVVSRVGLIIYGLGYHKTIYKHYPGPCRVVPGVETGSEDIAVTSNGLALISSGVRVKGFAIHPARTPPILKGKIFLFDFNHPEKNLVEVPLKGSIDAASFYPHGLSLYEDPKTGEKRLFVVNHHLSDQDRVEIFRFDEKSTSLHHLKTVTGETMYSLNDVVAVGPETFYFTNDLYYVTKFAKYYEVLAGLSFGTVGFYDGQDRIVADGFKMSNGINKSPDGRYVYVAAALDEKLTVFERKDDGSLEEIQRIDVCSGLDNIEVDKKSGDLWLGCHPVSHMFMEHTENFTKPAGSQVLRVQLESKSAPYARVDIREVLMDDGSLVSGSSVASYYDNKLLVGTVFDKLAYCEIKAI